MVDSVNEIRPAESPISRKSSSFKNPGYVTFFPNNSSKHQMLMIDKPKTDIMAVSFNIDVFNMQNDMTNTSKFGQDDP